MPFKSKKQAAFMFAKHPEIAKEFAFKTKSIKSLPTYSHPDGKNPDPEKFDKRRISTYNKMLTGKK